MIDLIDRILPTPRIHLLAGNSNSGKTRFIVPAIHQSWSHGEPIMGFASHPVPWAYVAGDRLKVEAESTMESMGIDPATVPIIPAFGPHNKKWQDIMVEAARMRLGLLVWEGFADFNPGRDTRKAVREFLSAISAACYAAEFHEGGGLTVLGIMESPKMKPHEIYPDPRQRVSGVASWGYHSSTVLLIEAAKLDASSPYRTLHASLKNAPNFEASGKFDALGRLIFEPPKTLAEEYEDIERAIHDGHRRRNRSEG